MALRHWIRFLPDGGESLSGEADAIEAKARHLEDLRAQVKRLEAEVAADNRRLRDEATKTFRESEVAHAQDRAYWQKSDAA